MSNQEKQLTYAPRNHQLTNTNVWTPDSQWLVFDVRPDGASFTGQTIERVNTDSCEVEIVYQATEGAHVGVVTVAPQWPLRYVFIHGPEHPDQNWHYDFHHRRGTIVDGSDLSRAVTLDAMDITPPFTRGALRGGSHVHVFSPDGHRLSFTYNDHVMHELDPAQDLRNVGVAVPLQETVVKAQHPREYNGSHYCVLVSQTTFRPRPGSDQINRAYEEGWVGLKGYKKSDGTQQDWALAFIGDTLSAEGVKLPEVFIVDLPSELSAYTVEGDAPLMGTANSLPAPPKAVVQRRLTYTANQRYPGIAATPRHWLRSAPDGSNIAFLMKDNFDVTQLWMVSPNGGELRQITQGTHSVQSAFNWSPNGRMLAFVMDNSVAICDAMSGVVTRLTERSVKAPLAEAVVFSPDGQRVAFMREVDGYSQLFCVAVDPEGESGCCQD